MTTTIEPVAAVESPAIGPPTDAEIGLYASGGTAFTRLTSVSKLIMGLALAWLSTNGGWLLAVAPFAVLMIAGAVLGLLWSFDLRVFDLDAHDRFRRRWSSVNVLAVDVFITTCGEDPSVVRETIRCARALDHPGRVTVYVLDDAGSFDIERLANELGARYIRRSNRGWMKKAGNIDHALTCSDGDLVLVLDADFCVRPDFLEHCVPYFSEKKLGILQTPQFFRANRDNWVEAGAAEQQEAFYRIAQRARNRFGGAICVGTNALYRRDALEAAGGVARIQHSEDIFTGLKILESGYSIRYLPLVLAAGSCPDTPSALGRQQYRWALGTFALVGTPLFKRARLHRRQRLGIWDGWIFYVTSALSPVVALVTPILCLAQAPESIRLWPSLLLVPTLITELVIAPRWYLSYSPRAAARAGLVSQMAHLSALVDHICDREQEWIPTAARSNSRQRTDRIPDVIAVASMLGFVAVAVLTIMRLGQGWSVIQFLPLIVLAVYGLRTALSVYLTPTSLHGPPSLAPVRGRELTLDVIRTVSLARVIVWHALGYWWISWVFGAMPAVFYVSGAVMTKSLAKQSVRKVVWRRLRRLLPTYFAFVAVAFGLVALATPTAFADDREALLSWVVPYRSPAQLPWEDGWLSTPLWFLRALVVVLLLCPLLLGVLRRVHGPTLLCVWIASLVYFDHLVQQQTTEMATAVWRGVADVVCYGGFFVLGVRFHERRAMLTVRHRALIAALCGVAGVVIAVVWTPHDIVVNNSYVLSAVTGLGWLLAFLALERPINNIALIPSVSRVVTWFTGVSMSVYLWHTLAICLAYWIVGEPQGFTDVLGLLIVSGTLVWFVVRATQPIEQRTNGTQPVVHRRTALAVGAIALLLASQSSLFPQLAEAAGPPAPSGRPPVGAEAEDAVAAIEADGAGVEGWLDQAGVDYSAIAIDGTGRELTFTRGEWSEAQVDKPFEVMSVSKTMVAAVALRYVDQGRLTLDGPLPDVPTLPDAVVEQLSLRRLLAHATGLVDYRDAPGYREDRPLTREQAVAGAASVSDLSVLDVEYASTNYIATGLLLEHVGGAPLDEILQRELFEPLGLDSTRLVNNDRDGFVGQGSAGVVSTLSDITRWYDALYRTKSVLPAPMLDQMLLGGREFSDDAGLGSWRHCPCRPPTYSDPTPWYYSYHDGGDVRLLFMPDLQLTVAIRVSVPLYGTSHVVDVLDALLQAVIDQLPTEGPPPP